MSICVKIILFNAETKHSIIIGGSTMKKVYKTIYDTNIWKLTASRQKGYLFHNKVSGDSYYFSLDLVTIKQCTDDPNFFLLRHRLGNKIEYIEKVHLVNGLIILKHLEYVNV